MYIHMLWPSLVVVPPMVMVPICVFKLHAYRSSFITQYTYMCVYKCSMCMCKCTYSIIYYGPRVSWQHMKPKH